MVSKILIVEDEISLQETLAYNFKREGYMIETASNGVEGLAKAREWKPDLILLDVMLPQMNGFEVCRNLRAEMDIPILFLTAKADEIDRVVGLEIGGDDYILKPFSMRELIARVKARLRVHQQLQAKQSQIALQDQQSVQLLSFGNLVINPDRHEVLLDGNPVALQPKEYDLLLFLVENRGRALSRETILERVWGWDYIGESRTVDVHIRWLRNKIEKDPAVPQRIITVRGAGYRFEG